MTGEELINLLKGKEKFEVELNVKFYGRSVTVSSNEIEVDVLEDYNKLYLTANTRGLNYGFDFDDGKGNEWKKK